MQKVFITGSTGFIGRNLVESLSLAGIPCVCLVRRGADIWHLQRPSVRCVIGSLEQPATYAESLGECDLVIHLAGLTHALGRGELLRVNSLACGYLADACLAASVRRVVYVSSLAAAGPSTAQGPPLVESDPETPISDYGRSKLQGEHEFRLRATELRTSVIRPGVVYGPGDKKLAQMINGIARWRVHVAVGRPDPPLAFIHVNDLVRLILAVAATGETLKPETDGPAAHGDGIYFACDDSEFLSFSDFGQRIGRAFGPKIRVWQMRRPVGYGVAWVLQTWGTLRGKATFLNVDKIREATAPAWTCSAQKARQQFGFQPAQTLDDYLPEMVTAYINRASAGPLPSARV